jgi:ubiquinol-cytochrome c reductase cytochrome b subunit
MPIDRRRSRRPLSERLSYYVVNDTRWGRSAASHVLALRERPFPLHWTAIFGVATVACVAVLFITGVFLMFFYTPSSTPVSYHGGYAPLRGATVSAAFDSTMRISFEVRGGLLMRQAHHWAALLLPATLIMQILVSFFTGAFRRPRRAQWVLLFLVFVVALIGGWSGYALPDDMLSGTGLRIVEGIVLGVPFIGTWTSTLLFGGEFPGEIIAHLYPIHIVLVPVAFVILTGLQVLLAASQRPPQFAAQGRSEHTVVGIPLPTAGVRVGGVLVAVVGLLVLMAALVTVSPIWVYGPSAPGEASAGSQPDWYTGFLDGALRLVPSGWEFVWLGHTWSLFVVIPLAVVTIFMTLVLAYPFIEHWIIGDEREHHLLQRPRDTPVRTAIGAAGVVFYGVLWGAGSADVVAHQSGLSLESIILFCQVTLFVGPAIAFAATKAVCLALQRRDDELVLRGYETGRIVRLPGGGYIEVHKQLSDEERWRVVSAEQFAPIVLRPDGAGRLGVARRIRSSLSRVFFEARLRRAPVLGPSTVEKSAVREAVEK